MTGPRWLAIDADMFAKRFAHDLHERFGPAGVAVWVAFLCACKRSKTPGSVRMASDIDGMVKLEIYGWELVDRKGEPWTLTEFFDFCGRKKQTKRTWVQRPDSGRIADARLRDVCATHWQRWQDDSRINAERARKRRWWAENRVEGASSTSASTSSTRRADNDNDIYPLTPRENDQQQGASPPAPPPSNLRGNGTNPRARGTNPRARQQEAERAPIREWVGDALPEPTDFRPDIKAALPPPPSPKGRPQ